MNLFDFTYQNHDKEGCFGRYIEYSNRIGDFAVSNIKPEFFHQ
jgi:hypothetical protein